MDVGILMIFVMVALLAFVLLAWPYALRGIARRYYQERYQPLAVKSPEGGYPAEHHLRDVPWITSPDPLCQSISLQMIAAQKGIAYPRPNYDFLMAFTYGMSGLPGAGFMPFGTDPEIGFLVAAPYLGLKRCYYTTGDEKAFTAALRWWISRGYAVRIAVDQGTLYGSDKFSAHSVVLVGYDPRRFYFYETVAQPPARVPAGERPAGELGEPVEDEKVLSVVRRMAQELRYPWRYAFTIFEEGPVSEDLSPVWEMAGKAMSEEYKYGPRMGPKVLDNMAGELQREGKRYDLGLLKEGFALAAKIRRDNAWFLRANFPYDTDVKKAIQHIESAASQYQEALDAMQDGIGGSAEAKRVASIMSDIAAEERKAGEVFIQLSKREHHLF